MSKRANGPKLELKLNLSPPRREHSPAESLNVSTSSSSEMSVEGSSCVSSEPEDQLMTLQYSPSNTEPRSMMLVGCSRCLMYVLLSGADPKCPKCKSTVLLDFLREENTRNTRN